MDRIIAWNVGGVNNKLKHTDIKLLISQTRVGFVSLLETKVRNKYLGKLYESLFSGWCFTSNNSWLDRGRIIIAWNPVYFTVDIQKCTQQLIHCLVQFRNGKWCYITCVYGFNEEAKRKDLWKDIRGLAEKIYLPWLAVGDYNDILEYEERIGRRRHHRSEERRVGKECMWGGGGGE